MFAFGGRNSFLRLCLSVLLILLSSSLVRSQSCDDVSLVFDGIGAGGYAHSITFLEDGDPMKIVPESVNFTSATNILSVQVVLGWLQWDCYLVYLLFVYLFTYLFINLFIVCLFVS